MHVASAPPARTLNSLGDTPFNSCGFSFIASGNEKLTSPGGMHTNNFEAIVEGAYKGLDWRPGDFTNLSFVTYY
jgi:hypothetical protein